MNSIPIIEGKHLCMPSYIYFCLDFSLHDSRQLLKNIRRKSHFSALQKSCYVFALVSDHAHTLSLYFNERPLTLVCARGSHWANLRCKPRRTKCIYEITLRVWSWMKMYHFCVRNYPGLQRIFNRIMDLTMSLSVPVGLHQLFQSVRGCLDRVLPQVIPLFSP